VTSLASQRRDAKDLDRLASCRRGPMRGSCGEATTTTPMAELCGEPGRPETPSRNRSSLDMEKSLAHLAKGGYTVGTDGHLGGGFAGYL